MSNSVEIVRLYPFDCKTVAAMLQRQPDEHVRHFHPFEFDATTVQRAVSIAEQDLYWQVLFGGETAGLLMLRGWDEGYTIPALGILIDDHYTGSGLADAAMLSALSAARLRGCERVMLHVHADNARAQRFFARHGFAEASRDGERLRLECALVGDAATLSALSNRDTQIVRAGIRQAYGFDPGERYSADFARFVQEIQQEIVL